MIKAVLNLAAICKTMAANAKIPMMKKILASLTLYVMAATPSMGQSDVALVMWHPDGSTTDVELYTQPQVLFQNDSVFVTSPVADLKYAASDVLRFTYKGNGTGIESPKMERNVTQENGQLVFNGVENMDDIALYTIDGMRVPVRLLQGDGNVFLPLNSIPKGMYVLNVNGKTSKFTKK